MADSAANDWNLNTRSKVPFIRSKDSIAQLLAADIKSEAT